DNSSAGAQRPPSEVADMAKKFTGQIYCQGAPPKTATGGTAGTLAPSDVADFGTKFDVQPMPEEGSTRPQRQNHRLGAADETRRVGRSRPAAKLDPTAMA